MPPRVQVVGVGLDDGRHHPGQAPAQTSIPRRRAITSTQPCCCTSISPPTAHKAGNPDPYPWFSEACAFLFANDLEMMAYAAAGEKPTLN